MKNILIFALTAFSIFSICHIWGETHRAKPPPSLNLYSNLDGDTCYNCFPTPKYLGPSYWNEFIKKQETFLSGLSKRYKYNWQGQAVKIGQWDTVSIIIDSVLELYQQYGRLNYVVRKSDTPKFNLDQTDTIAWYMPGKGQRGAKWDTDIVFHVNRWKWTTQVKLNPYLVPPAKINCTSPFEDSEGIKKSLTWTIKQGDTSFDIHDKNLYDTVIKIMCISSGVKQIEFTAPTGYEVFSTNDNKYHQRITIYRNSDSVDSCFYLMIHKKNQ